MDERKLKLLSNDQRKVFASCEDAKDYGSSLEWSAQPIINLFEQLAETLYQLKVAELALEISCEGAFMPVEHWQAHAKKQIDAELSMGEDGKG